MKKKTLKFIIPFIISFVVYLILDYVNLLTILGIKPANINFELFGILFDTLVVISLFVISFFYIDNRQNEKDANARDTVDVLLSKTYAECLSNLKFLDNKEVVQKYIIPKIDGDKMDSENKVINNLQTLPFESFDTIMDLAKNGYVDKEKLSQYLDIKKDYQHLISVKITFYDLVKPENADQKEMYDDIQKRDIDLKNKLKKILKEKQLDN